jgi:two-component system NarL family sensor kinase
MVADAFLIMLRNDSGGYDLSYILDLGREYAPSHDVRMPGAYIEAMEQGRPFIIEGTSHPDFTAWERYGDMTRRVQSLLVAPLLRGNDPIGIISAQSYAPNSYRQRDADLLTTVANVAAIAIENARLYEQAYGLAVAEERNRLAREIHDTIAQGLVGIVLQLEAVSAMIEPDSRLARRISRAMELGRVNLDEARRSVRDLRAAPLEHMTLTEALRQLAEQHQEECGGQINLLLPEAMPRLETSTETTVFRFVQESLTNCRKHAPGTDVWIEVSAAEQVRVAVTDNGPGFDVAFWANQAPTHHFGLHGMRERAERLGGSLQIESALGVGTTLVLAFPVDSAA